MPESFSPAPAMESSNGHKAAKSAKPASTKKAAKSAGPAKSSAKTRSNVLKKNSAPRKPRAKKEISAADSSVTDDQIRLRAYFISEERAQSGVAGDSARDWLEAVRQLQTESALA